MNRASAVGWTTSNKVARGTPRKFAPSIDPWVTQWMSSSRVCCGMLRSSFSDQLRCDWTSPVTRTLPVDGVRCRFPFADDRPLSRVRRVVVLEVIDRGFSWRRLYHPIRRLYSFTAQPRCRLAASVIAQAGEPAPSAGR